MFKRRKKLISLDEIKEVAVHVPHVGFVRMVPYSEYKKLVERLESLERRIHNLDSREK
jgi:hypothetical protein